MKTCSPSKTVFHQSYYHTPRPEVLAALPVVLRAGHLQAAADYRIERRTSQGHDLLFCLSGTGKVRLKNRVFTVAKNEIVWINGYEPHEHWADPACPWELLWLRMDGPGLETLRSLLGINENPVFQFVTPTEVKRTFRKILRFMSGPTISREDSIHIEIARLTALLRHSRQTMSSVGNRTIPKQIEAVINRLALYPQQRWTALVMAKLAGMSVAQFYRMFHQITGTSPIDWLRRERINLAKRRLIESEDSIKTVAEHTGYNSPYFFSRDFKRHTGQAPSEFRRQERVIR